MTQLQVCMRPMGINRITLIAHFVFLFFLVITCHVFGENATQLNDSLNVYSRPSFHGEITCSLSKDKSVFIIHKSTFIQNDGRGPYYWYFVQSHDEQKKGWAFGEFLVTHNPTFPYSLLSEKNLLKHGNSVPQNFTSQWWGVFRKYSSDPSYLQQVCVATATRASVFDDVVETYAIVPNGDQCTFLVRNIPNLREGILEEGSFARLDLPEIASEDDKERGIIEDVASIRYSLKFKKSMFMLDGEKNSNGFRIVLYSKKYPRQVLFSSITDNDGSWGIVWFGDIDFDGKPDLLIQATAHYNNSNFMLFLSSFAEQGECVGFFTSFATSGC